MPDNEEPEALELNANRIIEAQLDKHIAAVEKHFNADLIAFSGPMFSPADIMIQTAIEGIERPRGRVLLVLETTGGLSNIAEKVALILRHHYDRVDFLVPSHAMSAGTILVMSGDAIWMDYASMLGPIDPQIQSPSGQWVPALGYLDQYKRFIEKAENGGLTTAEITYFVQNFDPAALYQYEQERELSTTLLKEWLVEYKFKDWHETESRGKAVSQKMKTDRARMIARKLSQADHWHSHSRGISMEVLRRDLKLLIDDFGEDPKMRKTVRNYYHLLLDYSIKRGHDRFVVNRRKHYVGF